MLDTWYSFLIPSGIVLKQWIFGHTSTATSMPNGLASASFQLGQLLIM